MIDTSLPAATAIYSCRSAVQVEHHRLPHPAFKEFSFRLRTFERELGEEVENEYWKPFLRSLKRYRFEVTAAPLGFGNPIVMPADLLGWLHAQLEQCTMLYPKFAASSRKLLQSLDQLVEGNDNPLLDHISRLSGSARRQKLTVLLKESRLITTFEDTLSSRHLINLIEVVGEGQLRGSECFDEIVCIGPSRWFASYIFSAPRAPRIQVLHFDWIKDQWRDSAVFIGSAKSQKDSGSDWQRIADEARYDTEEIVKKAAEEPSDQLEVEELLPILDLDQISNRLAQSSSVSNSEQDEAEARLFQLEDGSGVFLDADEGSSWLVIDLGKEEEARVKRINVSSIEPGMFVLLREVGGGDYIVPVADTILGQQASNARGLQRHWKSKLRDAVQSSSSYTVSMQLKSHGSVRANEGNVRNWMSARNIRTDDERDFTAIMRFVGLGEETAKYWKNAALIDRAHRQAGGHIRKLLLRQVLKADLRDLERLGRMRFELSESGGGQMIALRVVACSPTINRMPLAHIGRLFELEGDVWRG
ncbi:MAG TPA: hypothetical protein VEW46_24185 [Pyrinomonadaceae bacterium]|nr:hypothetical protein [Pyrinomonadaceae bacterium]